MKKIYAISMIVLVSVLLNACTNLGPKYLPKNRINYNKALHNSTDQQLLLNLVRLKYNESPYFLQVSNIASQVQFTNQFTGVFEATLQKAVSPLYNITATPELEFTEKPTISYIPLQGEEFTTRVLTPLSLDKLYLLIRSHWRITRIFAICGQRVGTLDNIPAVSSSTRRDQMRYGAYIAMVRTLDRLARLGEVVFYFSKYHKNDAIFIEYRAYSKGQTDWRHFLHLLGLHQYFSTIILTDTSARLQKANVLSIQTRSFMGMMYFLSKGVHCMHIPSQNKNGFQGILNIMRIHVASRRPTRAALAVPYHGRWFYVADDDYDTRKTLVMVNQIFSLQSGKLEHSAPLLTIST